MKVLLSILFSTILTVGISQTNCDSLTYKILMVGDSWSNFPVGFGSFENNLDRHGFTNIGMFSNTSDLSINGAETHDFLTTTGITAIQNALNANPNIEIVNLSIGGNDILNTWNNSMDSIATDSLLDATMLRIDSIITNIQALKPGIIIYMTGYDFANFGEVIQTYASPTFHPFYARWNGMGQPDFLEMNKLLTRASDKFSVLANTDSKVQYSNGLGLMQFLYGQSTALGVAPSGTYAAGTVTFPGGRLDYPTPKSRMNNYGFFRDCFHLDTEGFDMFYKYHFEEYYLDYLRGNVDLSLTSEGMNNDGGVTSTSTISASNVTIGNSTASGISKGIVSFNTSSIPAGTAIHEASIFLYRDNQTGTLPVFNKVILESKQGNFGTSTTLDFGDYNSSSDALDTACTYGTVSENGFWLRISIPASILSQISTSGVTQFRISMIDSTDGNTLFFSTGDSTNKPFMDIEYLNPTSINSVVKENDISIYPNPTASNFITITNFNSTNSAIKVVDVTGRVFHVTLEGNQLDISTLSQGTYFILINSNENLVTKRFVKL